MALKADLNLQVSGLGTPNVTETVVYMLTCHLYQAEGPLLVLSVLQMNPQDESEIGSGLSRMVITSSFTFVSLFLTSQLKLTQGSLSTAVGSLRRS